MGYPAGEVPKAFVAQLALRVKHARANWTRGVHTATSVRRARTTSTRAATRRIRTVGADGTRFAAPSLIYHCVAVHRYQPPVVFIAAVMRTTHLEVDDALERDLCLGCGLALERLVETNAVRNGSLESVVLVRLRCDRCATEYEQTADLR